MLINPPHQPEGKIKVKSSFLHGAKEVPRLFWAAVPFTTKTLGGSQPWDRERRLLQFSGHSLALLHAGAFGLHGREPSMGDALLTHHTSCNDGGERRSEILGLPSLVVPKSLPSTQLRERALGKALHSQLLFRNCDIGHCASQGCRKQEVFPMRSVFLQIVNEIKALNLKKNHYWQKRLHSIQMWWNPHKWSTCGRSPHGTASSCLWGT